MYNLNCELKSYKKIFKPSVDAIKDLDISFSSGEIISILGMEKSGKTSLLKMISGKMRFKGKKNYNPKLDTKLFDYKEFNVNINNTVFDAMLLVGKKIGLTELETEARLSQLREIFNIEKYINTPLSNLSTLNLFKTRLAFSLLINKRVLLIDQDIDYLTNQDRINVLRSLKRLNKEERTTIIISSSNFGYVEKITTRVIILDKGYIIYDNSLSEFKKKFCNKRVLEVYLNKNVSFNREDGVNVVDSGDGYYKLVFDNKEGMFAKVISMFDVNNIVDLSIEYLPLIDMIDSLRSESND